MLENELNYWRMSVVLPQAFLSFNTRIVFLSGVTLGMTALQDGFSSVLNRTQLTKIKCKAIRAGVWFRVLPRIDRVLIDLTIKVAKNIRSSRLAKSILAVMGKLEGLLESSVLKSMRSIGRSLAEKLSLIAQKWGNTSAKNWATDLSFAFFLGTMHVHR